jgi:hypothetical protein
LYLIYELSYNSKPVFSSMFILNDWIRSEMIDAE